jgi:hypothetical protein
MPKSTITIPHFEQVGRLIESECAVAGWYLLIGLPHILFLAGVSDSQSPGACQWEGRRWAILPHNIGGNIGVTDAGDSAA